MAMTSRTGSAAMFALLALTSSRVAAQEVTAGDLVIEQPWARATPEGAKVAGGYVTVRNRGRTSDVLTNATFADAANATIHDMTREGGVMRMRPAGPLEIPPGGSLVLSPDGSHLMFTGLKRGLRKGEAVDGTLGFARAGSVPVRFSVEGIGARGPARPDVGATPGETRD